MSIAPEIIESIREKASLVDFVSEVVSLKRSGKSHTGLCPFHGEKTPSFHVNEEEGFYHCFGCGKHGSVFDFVMETKGLNFPEAVRFIAGRIGVTVPEQRSRQGAEHVDRRKILKKALNAAVGIYEATLAKEGEGKIGREYLRRRGLSNEIIKEFRLGYAPKAWSFLLSQISADASMLQGFSPQEKTALLLELGLIRARQGTSTSTGGSSPGKSFTPERNDDAGSEDVSASKHKSEDSGYYDTFRERVIFPITRSDGSIIALGGRLLRDAADKPKYVNSSENILYAKRKNLYGLSQALPALRSGRHGIVVEGYFDVLALVQFGLRNVVATCGTALTDDHAAVLKRFCDRVTLLFDGDRAGRKAATQGFEAFLNSGVDVGVVFLPDGEDPDTYVRKIGEKELSSFLSQQRQPASDVFLQELLLATGGEPSAVSAGKAAARYAEVLARVKNPVEREAMSLRGAELLGVSHASLLQLLEQICRQQTTRNVSSSFASAQRFSEGSPRSEFAPRRLSSDARASAPPQNLHREEFWNQEAPAVEIPPYETPGNSSAQARPEGVTVESQPETLERRALQSFFRQLAVAVILEPRLAQSLRDLPSVKSFADQADGAEDVELRRKVFSFVDRLLAKSYADQNVIQENGEIDTRYLSAISEDLRHVGLDSESFLEEARRQKRVGGSKPKELVGSAGEALPRLGLREEIRKIQLAESGEQDQKRLTALAQEKLLRKRDLAIKRN